MPFQFSLAALLRFRQSIEQRQEILLQQANQRVGGLRRGIESVQRATAEVTANDARELASGLRAAELHFSQVRRSVLLEHGSRLEKELAAALQIQLQQRLAFQKARQQREVVDTLKEHQLQEFNQQESRDEQRRLDDLFLLRRQFLHRHDW